MYRYSASCRVTGLLLPRMAWSSLGCGRNSDVPLGVITFLIENQGGEKSKKKPRERESIGKVGLQSFGLKATLELVALQIFTIF